MILKKHITLCGMPGSGKSTVGKHLAKRLKTKFVDLDAFVEENEQMTIPEIFKGKGEAAFREMEMRYLSLLLRQEPAIIALGGGALASEGLFELASELSDLVYISVELPTLIFRLKDERAVRPLLSAPEWEGRLAELEQSRRPVFERVKWKIDGEMTVEEIVERIVKQVESLWE
jgi:shikimate kinase